MSPSLIPLRPPPFRIVLKECQNVDWEIGGQVWLLWCPALMIKNQPLFICWLQTLKFLLPFGKEQIASGLLNSSGRRLRQLCRWMCATYTPTGFNGLTGRGSEGRDEQAKSQRTDGRIYSSVTQVGCSLFQRNIQLRETGSYSSLENSRDWGCSQFAFPVLNLWDKTNRMYYFPPLQTSLGLGWNVPLQWMWCRYELKLLSNGWKCRD